MKETKNVPQLRFSGFDDEWEEKKLNEYLEPSKQKNLDNKYSKNDVLSVSGEFGIVNQIEFQGRSFAGEYVNNYGVVETNDIVYTKSPLNANPYGIIKSNFGKTGIVSTLYAVYKSKNNVDPCFIQTYFDLNKRLNDYLRPLVRKGAKNDMKVSSEDALLGNVVFPSKLEQQKIGAFLSHIDSLIQAKTKKLESLKAVKKSLLQKCFPKAGEKVPEMRFAGFKGEWEEKKLGEIAEKFDYGLNAAATDFDGKNKYLRITDIDDENRYFKYDDVSSPDCILSESENYLLKENDIVFARTGASVGKSYIYNKQDGIVYFAGFLIRAHIKQEYDSLFIFQNTLTESYNKYIQLTSQRSGQPGVNAEEYKEYSVMCPSSLDEQQKIGQFFSKYDSLISAQQKEIDKLTDIKKSLLQKMFV